MSIDQWSATPTSNDMPNYFQTGMRPSSVKTAGWDVMADLKSYVVALPTAGGTANALTAANGRPLGTLTVGLQQWLVPAAANTGPATFAPDGLTAANIFANGAGLLGGELQANVPASLKFDGTQWNLQNPVIPTAATSRNFFVDPCCRIAQGATKTLSTSRQYAFVDLVQAWASGTAVSAGTIGQGTAADAGSVTDFSCSVTGATITGTGKVFFRRFIESQDAEGLRGNTVTFTVRVAHNVGSPINGLLTVNYATAANNFSSVTNVGSCPAVAVPSGTGAGQGAYLTYTVALPLGAWTGIELIVELDCGAVTTKNFYATDWQAHLGCYLTVCAVPRFTDDLMAAMRYFEKSYDYGAAPGTVTFTGCISVYATNNAHVYLNCPFKATKINSPTVTIYSANTGSAGKMWDGVGLVDIAASTASIGVNSCIIQNSVACVSGDVYDAQWTADSRM